MRVKNVHRAAWLFPLAYFADLFAAASAYIEGLTDLRASIDCFRFFTRNQIFINGQTVGVCSETHAGGLVLKAILIHF